MILEDTIHIQPHSCAEWNAVVKYLESLGYGWKSGSGRRPIRCFDGNGFRHITAWGKTAGGCAGSLTHGRYANHEDAEHPLMDASAFLANDGFVLTMHSFPQITRKHAKLEDLIEAAPR